MLNKNSYTDTGLLQTEISPYQILLTDLENLCNDLVNCLLPEIDKAQKKVNKIYKEVISMKGRLNEMERQGRGRDRILGFVLGVLIILMIRILYKLENTN